MDTKEILTRLLLVQIDLVEDVVVEVETILVLMSSTQMVHLNVKYATSLVT